MPNAAAFSFVFSGTYCRGKQTLRVPALPASTQCGSMGQANPMRWKFVSAAQIARKAELAKRFASARPVKGTRAFHRFIPLDSHTAAAFKLSESSETRSVVGTPCVPLKVPMRRVCIPITSVSYEYRITFFYYEQAR